ncbi:hypothetical protein K456DRAFT_444837 [Colletotrichum gloeosporioides 23]|nr:hypothetical protein K456DRAFT_444837 [Colletotrichum gloeosporioides 23]
MEEIGVNRISILTRDGASTFRQMLTKTFIPPGLEICGGLSPYHLIIGPQYNKLDPSFQIYEDTFDILYVGGFTSVDDLNKYKEAPMFWHVRRLIDTSEFYERNIVEWFVGHGASVMNQAEGGWPNILFFLAYSASSKLKLLKTDEWKDPQIKAAVGSLQVTLDACNCFCSSSGCLPIHLLLRCYDRHGGDCIHVIGRLKVFQIWVRKWDVIDEEREVLSREMVRLKLFERLGMAHTCCRRADANYGTLYQPYDIIHLPDSEQQMIRNEDQEPGRQLERLMEHYQIWRLAIRGDLETFQEVWWAVVTSHTHFSAPPTSRHPKNRSPP